MKKIITFKDLWIGDRFRAYGSLWTKIDATVARKHSKESLALKERSYGYMGDTVCSFEDEEVLFIPATDNSEGEEEIEDDNVLSEEEKNKRIKECEEFFKMTSEEFIQKVKAREPLPHRLEDNLAYWLMLLGRGDLL